MIHDSEHPANDYTEKAWADRLEDMVLATERDPADVEEPQETVWEDEDGEDR